MSDDFLFQKELIAKEKARIRARLIQKIIGAIVVALVWALAIYLMTKYSHTAPPSDAGDQTPY